MKTMKGPRDVGGKVQEGVGRLTGDAHARAEGLANQAAGTAQDLYGQAADTARQTATTQPRWLAAPQHRDPTLHECVNCVRHRMAARSHASPIVGNDAGSHVVALKRTRVELVTDVCIGVLATFLAKPVKLDACLALPNADHIRGRGRNRATRLRAIEKISKPFRRASAKLRRKLPAISAKRSDRPFHWASRFRQSAV